MASYMEQFNQIVRENFDITDTPTRKCIVALEDAEQSQLLAALSSALYDKIVDKVDKIDFGTIPNSRGDITKVEGFENTVECLNIMKQMVVEYKEDPSIIDNELTAIENIKNRKAIFMKAYALNVELPIVLYNLMVMAIEQSVSFLISVCIQYVKDPTSQSMSAALDKVAYNNSRDNLMYEQIVSFNQSCLHGEIDKTLDHIIKTGGKVNEGADFENVGSANNIIININSDKKENKCDSPFQKFDDEEEKEEQQPINEEQPEDSSSDTDIPAHNNSGDVIMNPDEPISEFVAGVSAAAAGSKLLAGGLGLAKGAAATAGIGATIASGAMVIYKFLIKVLIPIMRNITYFVYNTKAKFSDYLSVQSQFLESNAYKLQYSSSSLPEEKKEKAVKKQLHIAEKLKDWANKLAIDNKKAKKEAIDDMKSDSKKMKIEDIKNELPADVYTKSVLF